MTAIFRYPGGKYKLRASLANVIESVTNTGSIDHYCEPFCGGASVALEVAARHPGAQVTLCDIDNDISDFWRCVVESDQLAYEVLEVEPTVDLFYALKEVRSPMATLAINRWSHSGRGCGPIGGNDQKGTWKINARWNAPSISGAIKSAHKLLRGRTTVMNCDGIEAIGSLSDVVIYCDPPYYQAGPSLYAFGTLNHDALISALSSTEVPWVLSVDATHDSTLRELPGVIQSVTYRCAAQDQAADRARRMNYVFGGEKDMAVKALRLAPPVPSEAEVLAMVQQYLAAHPKVARVIRINSGAAWMGKGEQKQFVRFCEIYGQGAIRRAAAGRGRGSHHQSAALQKAAEEMTELVPDLIGFLTDGRFLAIECKRGGWKKPAGAREKAQERFLAAVRESGGVAGFVASPGALDALIG